MHLSHVSYKLSSYICYFSSDILRHLENVSVPELKYNYSPNKLVIKESTFSRILPFQNIKQSKQSILRLLVKCHVSYRHLFNSINIIFLLQRFLKCTNAHYGKTNMYKLGYLLAAKKNHIYIQCICLSMNKTK